MEQSHTEQKSCSLILGPSYYAQSLVRYYPWVACPRFECCSQSQRHCGWSCCCSVTQLWPAFETPWTAACQTSLSITNSQNLLQHIYIKSVMPSNHLILCRPLLLLPSIFPSIRVSQWRRSSRKTTRCPRQGEMGAFFSYLTWRAIPGPLSKLHRRIDSL